MKKYIIVVYILLTCSVVELFYSYYNYLMVKKDCFTLKEAMNEVDKDYDSPMSKYANEIIINDILPREILLERQALHNYFMKNVFPWIISTISLIVIIFVFKIKGRRKSQYEKIV